MNLKKNVLLNSFSAGFLLFARSLPCDKKKKSVTILKIKLNLTKLWKNEFISSNGN